MRRINRVCFVFLVAMVILFGVAALAESPNLPADCEPCAPEFSPSTPVICPLSAVGPFQAYDAGGKWLGQWNSRCAACTFNTPTYCTVEGAPIVQSPTSPN